MSRTLLLAASIAALATPAFAEQATQAAAPAQADVAAAQAGILAATAGEQEARQHLVRQGYINVSPLTKDESGRWSGTAQKDGKTVFIALNVKGGKVEATN